MRAYDFGTYYSPEACQPFFPREGTAPMFPVE